MVVYYNTNCIQVHYNYFLRFSIIIFLWLQTNPQNKKECKSNKQWQKQFLRDWETDTKGGMIN